MDFEKSPAQRSRIARRPGSECRAERLPLLLLLLQEIRKAGVAAKLVQVGVPLEERKAGEPFFRRARQPGPRLINVAEERMGRGDRVLRVMEVRRSPAGARPGDADFGLGSSTHRGEDDRAARLEVGSQERAPRCPGQRSIEQRQRFLAPAEMA